MKLSISANMENDRSSWQTFIENRSLRWKGLGARKRRKCRALS